MPGQLLPKDTLLLRSHIGSGENRAGRKINLFSCPSGPGVEDCATGRYWILGWTEMVDMAIKEFDNMEKEETPNAAPSL